MKEKTSGFEGFSRSFVESICSANFYGIQVSPDLKSWKRHFDISKFCHCFEMLASVSKYESWPLEKIRKKNYTFYWKISHAGETEQSEDLNFKT